MSELSLSFPSFCNSGLGPGGNLGSLLSGSSSIVDACNGSEGRRGWLGGSFEGGSIVVQAPKIKFEGRKIIDYNFKLSQIADSPWLCCHKVGRSA